MHVPLDFVHVILDFVLLTLDLPILYLEKELPCKEFKEREPDGRLPTIIIMTLLKEFPVLIIILFYYDVIPTGLYITP